MVYTHRPPEHFRRGGNRFAAENATTQEQPERNPIPLERNALALRGDGLPTHRSQVKAKLAQLAQFARNLV
jgi:hypothetical protein